MMKIFAAVLLAAIGLRYGGDGTSSITQWPLWMAALFAGAYAAWIVLRRQEKPAQHATKQEEQHGDAGG